MAWPMSKEIPCTECKNEVIATDNGVIAPFDAIWWLHLRNCQRDDKSDNDVVLTIGSH